MPSCPTCHKGQRAVYYCRRGDCPALTSDRTFWHKHESVEPSAAISPPMPPPTVDVVVTNNNNTVDVNITRDGKGRSYRGEGTNTGDAVKDAVKKILDDPYAAEYVRRG